VAYRGRCHLTFFLTIFCQKFRDREISSIWFVSLSFGALVDTRRRTGVVFGSRVRVCSTKFDTIFIQWPLLHPLSCSADATQSTPLVLRVFCNIRRGAHRLKHVFDQVVSPLLSAMIYAEAGVPCARGTVSSLRLFRSITACFSLHYEQTSPQLLAAHDGLRMMSRDPPALCECSYIDRRSFKLCTCPCYIAMRTESPRCGADIKSGRARINWKSPGMAAVSRKCAEVQEIMHTYERRTLQSKCRRGKDAQSVLQS